MDIVLIVSRSEIDTRSCARQSPLVGSPRVTLRHQPRAPGFPARLKAARQAMGLTGAQLGERLRAVQETAGERVRGASKQAISGLEAGRQGCDTALCERLAEALGVSPTKLAYGLDVRGGAAAGYGERIRQARDARGHSMEDLAAALEYRDRSSIAHLEAERQLLDLALAERIAAELRVSPAWLAFGVEG